MRRDQEPVDDFVERLAFETELTDGTPVRIRPIAPKDRDRLAEAWEHFSERSRYLRFLQNRASLSGADLRYLTEIDYDDHFAWGAELLDDERAGIGIGRYIRVTGEPTVAEAAIAVIDEYQHRGLGGLLLRVLADAAAANGIERFRAYVSTANQPVIDLLTRLGAEAGPASDGAVALELPLPARPWPESRLYASLRAVAASQDPEPG